MIVYSSNREVIVCEASEEQQMLVDYFYKGGGRDLEYFDRKETGTFQIFPNIRCNLTVPGEVVAR